MMRMQHRGMENGGGVGGAAGGVVCGVRWLMAERAGQDDEDTSATIKHGNRPATTQRWSLPHEDDGRGR